MRRPPPRRFERGPEKNEPRVNEEIRAPRVLVIDQEGNKLGEFLTDDAIGLARERGCDLIEVAPQARPPVCRLGDFGKLKYEKKKKDAQARKTQTTVELKEIKLRPKTDDHDLQVKLKHARRFLEEGDKVKVTCRFRGREIAHREIGEQQCLWLAQNCEDLALIESPPKMEMKQMFMILSPKKAKVEGVRPAAPPPPPQGPPDMAGPARPMPQAVRRPGPGPGGPVRRAPGGDPFDPDRGPDDR